MDWWTPRPVCRKRDRCPWSDEDGRHAVYAQRRAMKFEDREVPGAGSLRQLHSVPRAVVEEILASWDQWNAAS